MSFGNRKKNGKIGPHELREAELMLAGKKEVAYFSFDYPQEHFQTMKKCLEDGVFQSIKFGAEENENLLKLPPAVKNRILSLLGDGPYENIVVYVPGAKNKALRLVELMQPPWSRGYSEAVEREIGQILGYSEDDINFYIEQNKRA